MRKIKSKSLGLLVGTLACATASATVIQGTSLQNQLTAAGAIIDVQTQQHTPDERWTVGATGVGAARLLFELAGFANQNAFGIYDVTDIDTRLTIFSGPNNPGSHGALQLADSGSNLFCAGLLWGLPACATFGSDRFGFFLATPDGTFFSETDRNADGFDHMVAFQGGAGRGVVGGSAWLANEFILAWEDLRGGGDQDYDDFGVIVESITAVPEPGTLALFGFGLLALAGTKRRQVRTLRA